MIHSHGSGEKSLGASTRSVPLRPIPPPVPAPGLRVPSVTLPPYRFVPGLNAHPMRHPEGHLYGHEEPTWTRCSSWKEDISFLRGCDLFDHRYFWESHEVWEGMWHQVDRSEPLSHLLQGLIQVAASTLKRHVNHLRGARQLHEMSIEHFEIVRKLEGDHFYGVPMQTLISHAQDCFLRDEWPKVPLLSHD